MAKLSTLNKDVEPYPERVKGPGDPRKVVEALQKLCLYAVE